MSGLTDDLARGATNTPRAGAASPLGVRIIEPAPSGRDLLLWKTW